MISLMDGGQRMVRNAEPMEYSEDYRFVIIRHAAGEEVIEAENFKTLTSQRSTTQGSATISHTGEY